MRFVFNLHLPINSLVNHWLCYIVYYIRLLCQPILCPVNRASTWLLLRISRFLELYRTMITVRGILCFHNWRSFCFKRVDLIGHIVGRHADDLAYRLGDWVVYRVCERFETLSVIKIMYGNIIILYRILILLD